MIGPEYPYLPKLCTAIYRSCALLFTETCVLLFTDHMLLHGELKKLALGAGYLQCDETTVRVCNDIAKGKAHRMPPGCLKLGKDDRNIFTVYQNVSICEKKTCSSRNGAPRKCNFY